MSLSCHNTILENKKYVFKAVESFEKKSFGFYGIHMAVIYGDTTDMTDIQS